MKITKEYLRTIIKEELEQEGFLKDLSTKAYNTAKSVLNPRPPMKSDSVEALKKNKEGLFNILKSKQHESISAVATALSKLLTTSNKSTETVLKNLKPIVGESGYNNLRQIFGVASRTETLQSVIQNLVQEIFKLADDRKKLPRKNIKEADTTASIVLNSAEQELYNAIKNDFLNANNDPTKLAALDKNNKDNKNYSKVKTKLQKDFPQNLSNLK